MARDYDGIWPDVRAKKIAECKGMAALAELIGETMRAEQLLSFTQALQNEADADERVRRVDTMVEQLAEQKRFKPDEAITPQPPVPFADVQLASDDDIPF
jgi:hypothetical protein